MPTSIEHDYLVIGAGPAGLQLGYFLQKHGRDYLILEAGDSAGTFFETFPRHRKLLSINKIYTGYSDREVQLRYDWNSLLCEDERLQFKHYSTRYFPRADDMKRYFVDFADFHALNIKYNTRVHTISRQGSFVLFDEQGWTYTCKRLIVATGVSKLYIPDAPGIELAENYSEFSIDPEDYKDQRVLILGKGNSAFETAESLTETARIIHLCSPNSLKIAWASHFSGHLRAVNNNFIDTYHLKGQNTIHDGRIGKIERKNGELLVEIIFTHANNQRMQLACDRVLICTGFRFDASPFDDTCLPDLTMNDCFPAVTSTWESTNIKDLYFAGTIMQVRDFHKTSSNVYHGFRYNIDFLSRLFEQRYHGKALQCRPIPLDEPSVVDVIIKRVSTSSALFLQFGFLGDLLVVPDSAGLAQYYECIPVDYIHDSALGQNRHYYIITLEYGEFGCNPLRIDRDPDPDKAHMDRYLHPIIRRFDGSTLLAEYHIPENMENDWRMERGPGERPYLLSFEFPGYAGFQQQQIFAKRLEAFFRSQLTATS